MWCIQCISFHGWCTFRTFCNGGTVLFSCLSHCSVSSSLGACEPLHSCHLHPPSSILPSSVHQDSASVSSAACVLPKKGKKHRSNKNFTTGNSTPKPLLVPSKAVKTPNQVTSVWYQELTDDLKATTLTWSQLLLNHLIILNKLMDTY